MNAEEAQKQTEQRLREQIELQYVQILKGIHDKINDGKFEFKSYDHLWPENKEKLLQDGFKVEGGNLSADSLIQPGYTISWYKNQTDNKEITKKRRFSFWKN